MVRARFIVQVRYGHFAEYLKALEQLNEIARERGWAEATFWVATAGAANELIAEVDYPDLATFFSPQLARDALSKLLEASKAPNLSQLTDYQWYLVHIALQLQIDLHNDGLRDEHSGLIRVGP